MAAVDTTQERRARIAVIGAGGVSSMHFDGFAMRPDRIDVVAVVDPSAERREWASSTYGIAETFSSLSEALHAVDFDVAVVCTPSHVRVETVRELAAAGKHILVEKPMAAGLDEALELVRVADDGGVQLAVDQNFREYYGFELARELIAVGRIGRVRAVNHRELMHRQDEGWRNEQPHHALMVMGVHWLDGFRMLVPDDATWLVARTFSAPSVTAIGETDASIQIHFGDVTVTYTDSFASWITDWDTIVLGDEGTLRITDGKVVVATAAGTDEFVNEYSLDGNKPLSAYRALEKLLDAIETGVEASNSGRDNLKTIALIDGAYRSAATGQPVTFVDGLLPDEDDATTEGESMTTEHTRRGGLVPAGSALVEPQEWGRLEWMVADSQGNSDVLTVGKCFIQPGRNNPVHHHPNCDEVLMVVRGTIRHRVNDEYVEMRAGDTISIPMGATHNAVNIGDDECELLIIFDTARRQVVGE